jgi:hypothetical protein
LKGIASRPKNRPLYKINSRRRTPPSV